ncbi:MAG: hypothetical protein ACYDCK_04560 [Thermoplasmatota archaeon]
MARRPLVFLAGFFVLAGLALAVLDGALLALVWVIVGVGLWAAERSESESRPLLWRIAAAWALVWLVARILAYTRGSTTLAPLAGDAAVSVLALLGILRAGVLGAPAGA